MYKSSVGALPKLLILGGNNWCWGWELTRLQALVALWLLSEMTLELAWVIFLHCSDIGLAPLLSVGGLAKLSTFQAEGPVAPNRNAAPNHFSASRPQSSLLRP